MNDKVFKAINRFSGRIAPVDFLMIFLSKKIRYVYILVLIFMWFRNCSSRNASRNALISSGITLLLNRFIRCFFYIPRPFTKHRVGILIPAKTDSTFPSKHTLLVFAISTSIVLYERTLGLTMWILSMLTGFSRIWVGHHYPFDIIGSAFLSTVTSMFVDKMNRCSHKKFED